MQWSMVENDKSLGLVNMPNFSYKKNMVWTLEANACNLLRSAHVNMDHTYNLIFGNPVDTRDQRPLTYTGRFIFPSAVDPWKGPWGQTTLFKMRRTNEIAQQASKDMVQVEDLSRDAVPQSTDIGANCVSGSAKYEQIGTTGWGALLDSTLLEASLESSKHAIIVIDHRVRTAEFLLALIRKKLGYRVPLFWVGFVEDMVEMEWVKHHVLKTVSQWVGDGECKLPGFTPKAKDVPSDLLESGPPLPTLNVLVTGGASGKQLQIPHMIVQKYATAHQFSEQFNTFMTEFHAEFGQVAADDETLGTGKRSSTTLPGPSPKKQKLDKSIIVEACKVQGVKVAEVCLPNIKGAGADFKLQVRAPNKPYLVNMTSAAIQIPDGSYICGFGTGKFKLYREDIVPA